MSNWLIGLAFMLIIEGLGPLLAPSGWREVFRKALEMNDGQLRFMGLASIACGVLLLLFLK
ncbi:MAG: DUF2065 domain-containing protein [Burkholderiales bacterium]